MNNVLEGHAALTLRSRLRCIVIKKEDGDGRDGRKASSKTPTNLLVLNEVGGAGRNFKV